jgi:hypothetical protein
MTENEVTVGERWSDFMKRGGLALGALGILVFVAGVNTMISFYFIFGGAASWLGGKALEPK